MHKVLGEAATTEPVVNLSALQRVIGEADEEKPKKKSEKKEPVDKAPDKPKETETTPPANAETTPPGEEPSAGEEPPAAVDADIEAGEDDQAQSQEVLSLVSSWESGSKQEVASHLLYTPYSYANFVQLILALGPESAAELGTLLDELAFSRSTVNQPDSEEDVDGADRILDRVGMYSHTQPVGVAGAGEPAGETGLEQDQMP